MDVDTTARTNSTDNPFQPPRSLPEPETSAKSGSLLVIFLVVMIDLLGFGMVLPLLPIYAKQFTLDESGWQLGLLMASFSAMQFLFAPIWGILSDRVGRRPVLMFGLFGSVVFYTLFGFATIWQSLPWIFAARIGAGICGATISTAQAYIADTTSDAGRSRGMALVGMAFGVGFTFGPLLGYFAVPDGKSAPGPWLGYLAAILSGVALIMAAFLLPESLNKNSRSAAARFKLSNFGIAWQLAGVPAILGLIFMVVFSFAGFETTLTLLLKGELFDFAWGELCLTMALIGFSSAILQGAVVRPLYKRLSDKQMALMGSVLEVIGFLMMAGAVYGQTLVGFFGALLIVVAGFAFIQPSVHSLLSRMSPEDRQGAVLGTGQSVNALARILGSALAIPLLKWNLFAPYVVAAGLLAIAGIFLQRSLRARG